MSVRRIPFLLLKNRICGILFKSIFNCRALHAVSVSCSPKSTGSKQLLEQYYKEKKIAA